MLPASAPATAAGLNLLLPLQLPQPSDFTPVCATPLRPLYRRRDSRPASHVPRTGIEAAADAIARNQIR
jgi:hypothetical protein